jgi:hypothetical protein
MDAAGERAAARARDAAGGRGARVVALLTEAAGRRGFAIDGRRDAPFAFRPGAGFSWLCSPSYVSDDNSEGSPSTCFRAGQFALVHR